MRYSMALQISPEELAIARPADMTCSKHLSVINDIWSYEKEYIASKTLHDEGGVLCTCVSSMLPQGKESPSSNSPNKFGKFKLLTWL